MTYIVYASFPLYFSWHSKGTCANCGDFFGFTICNKEDKVVDWTKTYDVPKNMNPVSSDLDESEEPSVKIPLPLSSSTQSVYSYGSRRSKDGISSGEPSDTEISEPFQQS